MSDPTLIGPHAAIPVLIWQGCYGESWKGEITDESFCHPAKISRALCDRILRHGIERGYWSKSQTIGDLFGGVACIGIRAAYMGFGYIGMELEPRFCKLGNDNIARHRSRLAALGCPLPVLIQGDSRRFAASISGVVTSPPFTMTGAGGGGINKNGYSGAHGTSLGTHYQGTGGDREPGNIETLSSGSIDAAITSPPYAHIAAGAGGLNHLPPKEDGQQSGRANGPSQDTDSRYGSAAGQIAGLPEGSVDAVVTSPPYGDTQVAQSPDEKRVGWRGYTNVNGGVAGEASGRIDVLPMKDTGRGESYWSAMKQVYASMFAALKPGGVAAIVVKDYVSKGKRVPLCDDTLRLLQHCGFVPIERAHAMLVEETHHAGLFEDKVTTKRSRKSFFRRLAESKGSPEINFEEVLFVRRETDQTIQSALNRI